MNWRGYVALLALLAGGLNPLAGAQPNVGYASATVPNLSGYSSTATITWFPLPIDMSRFPAAWWTACTSSDGTKIQVWSSDGLTRYACDVYKFDTGTSTGWMRIGWTEDITSSSSDTVRITPSDSSLSSATAGSTYGQYATYDSDVAFYIPCIDEGSSSSFSDRTGTLSITTGGDFTSMGAPSPAPGTAGWTAFVASRANFIDTNSTWYAGQDSIVIHAMAMTIAVGDYQYFWDATDGSGGGLACRLQNDATPELQTFSYRTGTSPGVATGTTVHSTGTWRQVASRLTSTANTTIVNGVEHGTEPASGTVDSSADMYIGAEFDGSDQAVSYMTEIMAHTDQRTFSFLELEYNLLTDQAGEWGTWTWTAPTAGGSNIPPPLMRLRIVGAGQ